MSVFLSRLFLTWRIWALLAPCTHQLLLAPDLVLSLPGQLLLGYYGLHPLSLQPGCLLLHPPPLLLQPHGPVQLLLKLYRTKSANTQENYSMRWKNSLLGFLRHSGAIINLWNNTFVLLKAVVHDLFGLWTLKMNQDLLVTRHDKSCEQWVIFFFSGCC